MTLVAGGRTESVALEDDIHRLVLSHVQLVARRVHRHRAGVHGVVGGQTPEVGVVVVPAQGVLQSGIIFDCGARFSGICTNFTF